MKRRNFIAGATAAPTFFGTAALVAEADPVVALHRKWRALSDYLDGPDGSFAEDEGPEFTELHRLEREISTTRATSVQGVRCQVEFAVEMDASAYSGSIYDRPLYENMLASLGALAT